MKAAKDVRFSGRSNVISLNGDLAPSAGHSTDNIKTKKIKLCLIWTSLCMLFEVGSIDFHYMTDRQQRFDLKISKLKILWKQRHLCP